MRTFEVERQGSPGHDDWQRAGEADAEGDNAALDAISQVATETGSYRARIVGEPDYPWAYCNVTADAQTGEQQVQFLEVPPQF